MSQLYSRSKSPTRMIAVCKEKGYTCVCERNSYKKSPGRLAIGSANSNHTIASRLEHLQRLFRLSDKEIDLHTVRSRNFCVLTKFSCNDKARNRRRAVCESLANQYQSGKRRRGSVMRELTCDGLSNRGVLSTSAAKQSAIKRENLALGLT